MQSVMFGGNGLRLEGALHYPSGRSPAAAAVVCHPHPQRGGDMRNSVVGVIVRGLNAAGLIAFTFNFRGVGASQGSFDGGSGEQADVRAAIAYARGLPGVEQICLTGYSFGAGMAANVVDSSIARLGLVALPTRQLEAPALRAYDGPILLATGSHDDISSLDAIEKAAAEFGEHVTVAGIAGADHFWWGKEEELAEAVRDFFAPLVDADPAPSRV